MGRCRRRAAGRALLAFGALLAVAGCSSSSGPKAPTIQAARQFELAGFRPMRLAHPGPARLSFTIRQPSGAPLTSYRRGAGPHTGIHLIVVRDDLGVIIHRHPPVGSGGKAVQTVYFPSPGPYRVLVDAYPAVKGAPRNFQLHEDIHVGGAYRPRPLPPFSPVAAPHGYHVSLRGPKRIHPIEATTLTARVADPSGHPVRFKPWYGALAHAIFFRAGSLDYFHTHVCGPSTPGCTSIFGGARVVGRPAGPGQLHVGVLLPVAGTWRLFLQFRDRGRILTAPFTLRVQ
ncbi:MAG TPA: hypothetical protein VE753_09495 [Gaiellaceae bacterium]|nr:hypothetical protein [Gaiellaceae bacterium]